MIDIIIFAAIAAFLFWKLHGILGKEEEGRQSPTSNQMKDITGNTKEAPFNMGFLEVKKDSKEHKNEIEEALKQNISLLDSKFEENYRKISSTLSSEVFDLKQFIEGIENILLELLKAQTSKDLTQIANLSSPQFLANFKKFIEDPAKNNPYQSIELVKIEKTDFLAMDFTPEKITIKVKVLSEQIRFVKEGENVTSGSLKIPSKFADVFVIQRDLKNKTNWLLVEIE